MYIGKKNSIYKQNLYLRGKSIAPFKHFAMPQTALNYLRRKDSPAILFDRLAQEEHDFFDVSSINYLYEEIYNPRRYEAVSCIVYKEEIPNMKGLAFFQEIEHSPAKKILFTEKVDEKKVVAAFNQGIIDFYVCNQDPKAEILLNDFIQQSQKGYFKDTVNAIINSLLKDWHRGNESENPLLDPLFIQYIHTLIQEEDITEFYLLDLTGSFLFLDKEGYPSVLFAFNEQSFADHWVEVEQILRSEHSLSPQQVIDLKERRQTICFPFIYPQTLERIEKYIAPVDLLEGHQRYYLSHSKHIDYLNNC
jgi:DNA-binding NarL/FixJ family response regulator